jgi:hypothetical protein
MQWPKGEIMNTQSRIPKLHDTTFDGASMWFSELQTSNLLFHPEDDPADIIRISNGERFFSDEEVRELRFVMAELERSVGHEKVIEAAYPIFMRAFRNQLAA